MEHDFLLIGVDGGATEVKAHEVCCADPAQLERIELGAAAASRRYERLPDFAPLPVAEQLAQRDAGSIALPDAERRQGALWIEAATDAIAEVARTASEGRRKVLVGMGMPGLKTPDRRGITALNNGPRMPDFLEQLEARLIQRGIGLARPIAELGSDADYCGLGEEHAADGLFRGIRNAYYLGGGTGVADAMKLGGRLVTFDESKSWILKSWQMPSALGPTFEKLVSARSMNECFAALRGGSGSASVAPGEASGTAAAPLYPERCALEGDSLALGLLDTMALVLAELLFERLYTVYCGAAAAPQRGPAYASLRRDHPYVGTVLARLIIGQRLGAVFAESANGFADRTREYLGAMIHTSGSVPLAGVYLKGEFLIEELIVPSKLRAAPAIGAGVAALRACWGAV